MNVTVFGTGSWGTALACLVAGQGREVILWGRNPEVTARLEQRRENEAYLPGAKFPDTLHVTSDFEQAARFDRIILAVPSTAQREIARRAAAFPAVRQVLCAAKGFEPGTRQRLSVVLQEEFSADRGVAMLAGPSHAEETVHGIPTTVVVASEKPEVAQSFQEVLMTPTFRVYTNSDLLGVETAASFKNVIAIAAGICDGLGFGDNTKGALVTRGLAEMSRLGRALGANPETFYGLAGIGDLVTTCTSRHSRNRRFGQWVGEGKSLEEALTLTGQSCEGVETARSVLGIAESLAVELPISREVNLVLFEGKSPRRAIGDLMTRDAKSEG